MFVDFLKLLYTRYGEQLAIDKGNMVFKALFAGGLTWKQITASLLFLFELPYMLLFGTPITPMGPELDLTGYEQVFYDEFEGDTLDTEAWFYRGNGKSRCGYNAPSQVKVQDGNLIITGEYLMDGEYGEGWYSGSIALNKKYKQGYFEIKCICNKGGDFWSAFWIQADHPYTPEISKGGIGGAELDIFEANEYNNIGNRNSVTHTIHCSGKEGDTSGGLNSAALGFFRGKNIYKEYNTYGLKWTEDEYIFYINGVESVRSDFADGVSQVEELVLVSLCIPQEMSKSKERNKDTFSTEFIVDYVKIYQKV